MALRMLIVSHATELGGAERVLLRNLDVIDMTKIAPLAACPAEGPLAVEFRRRGVPVYLGFPEPALLDVRRQTASLGGAKALAYARDMTSTVLGLRRLIKDENVQLVLTNSAKADIYGAIAGRLAGRPVVWRLHDIVDRAAFSRLNCWLFKWGATLLATRVLGVSDAVNGALLRLGVSARRLTTVYNGLDVSALEEESHRADVRDEFGIGPGQLVAGFVGRLVRWKGTEFFLRAAAEVAQRFPDSHYLVVGDAMFEDREYADSLVALCKELGIESQVTFTGWREDVAACIKAMDVAVHSSILPEPLGTVLIEAMALGKPLVATNSGGVPEVVVEGETGLLVAPGDSANMASALSTLFSDASLRAEMGERGKLRAREVFDLVRNTGVLEEALTATVESSARGCPIRG